MLNKKLFYKATAFFLLFMIPGFLFSQGEFSQGEEKPIITIFPLENTEKDLQIEIISHNIQKTVELNLKKNDRYIVLDNDVTTYSSNSSWLLDYCEKNEIDDLIFGKTLVQADGSIFIELSVFNRQSAATTTTKSETAATIFDIFDAADKLAQELMGSLGHRMHLGFGELKFINSGEEGNYFVYIDNILAGENIASLTEVPLGTRHVVITQIRMFGNAKIYDRTISVEENQTTEVTFSIPGFLDNESRSVARQEAYIEKNWDKKNSAKNIDKSFNTLFDLLSIADYSQTATEKRKEVEERFAQWENKKNESEVDTSLSASEQTFGVSAFIGTALMYPSYEEKGVSGWESNPTFINPKFGIAFSANIPFNFAVQMEIDYLISKVKYVNDSLVVEKGADMNFLEIPVLLLYRLPGKIINPYVGGVFQIRVDSGEYTYEISPSGDKDDDKTRSLKSFGGAWLAGVLFEIPIKSNYFMSFDFRYTGSLSNWLDSKGAGEAILNPSYLHITTGFGLKF